MAAIFAFGLVVFPHPLRRATAASNVQVGDTTITITVPIDLIGGSDKLAKSWSRAIGSYWNNGPGLGRFSYCGKEVTIKADIRAIAPGEAGRTDAHAVFPVGRRREGQDFIDNVQWPSSDYDPVEENSAGFWGNDLSGGVVAHEFGHLLGLDDEYDWDPAKDDLNGDGVRNPKEPTHVKPEFGGENSIMAESSGRVLQRHIDALMELNGVAGKLHCRREWKGTMHSVSESDYFRGIPHLHNGPHRGTYVSTLEFVADADGRISGFGVAEHIGGDCGSAISSTTATEITFDISGTSYADRLELHLAFKKAIPPKAQSCGFAVGFFFGQPLVVPITGGGIAQGKATDHWDPSSVSHFEGTYSIRLTCQNCGGEG